MADACDADGFCQRDNPHDAVRVGVAMPSLSEGAPPPLPRQVFVVRRRDAGGVPAELLEALAHVALVCAAAEAAHEAGGDADAVAAAAEAAAAAALAASGEAGWEEEEDEAEGAANEEVEVSVEVGAAEVTTLIELLQRRLEPLGPTEATDGDALRRGEGAAAAGAAAPADECWRRRQAYVAMYRDGLRTVLREAIEDLQEMLLGAMAEAEGEEGDVQPGG